ncbi:hypothetical protein MSP8886_01426 [Marinomonas spartinae]|uniref:Uncharacterized protein n=1 Tax=Marinomonas spartinae TaxID=1792290 RepID=A0A1A8TB96_9GAMM|nr:hypothetical protein [Marinomonas spartinae]SBS29070.1 hypothetical protein MSP8886_01426 [Marinomonas spartinae]
MVSLLKFLLILIEWGVQLKRRDDEAQKQQRLHQARTDPANYLRQFGRVHDVKPDESASPMPGGRASADKHDSQ